MEPDPEQQIDLNIRGMTCDACTLHVEKALKSVDGVRSVQVSRWAWPGDCDDGGRWHRCW